MSTITILGMFASDGVCDARHDSGDKLRMKAELKNQRCWTCLATGLILLAGIASTGCQVELGGQTLPSPYYLTDYIQYYVPGPEFVLAREAAAMKEQADADESLSEF